MNSDILRFAHDVGAELNVFFKLLWRHVIAVEILSVRFDIDSENAVTQLFDRMSHKGRRRKRAMEYLQKWGPTFWKESDYRIKEITNRLEQEIEAGAAIGPITAGTAAMMSTEQRVEVRHRVQHVVNQGQVRELSEILTLLDDVLDDPQKRYFVLIDKLDEGWVHDTLRFRLIRALVETARDFAPVRHAKVVVTMRTDLYREVLTRTQESGFQREKHDTNLLSPRWTKAQLREVLERRVSTLVARRYTSARVTLDDIFYTTKKRQDDPVAYVLARTLMRPRDAIQYLNKIIQASNDRPTITLRAITSAETEYSRGRIDSIVDEWSASWPSLTCLLSLLPRGTTHLRLQDLDINDLVVRIFDELGLTSFDALPMSDPLARAVYDYYCTAEKNVTPSDIGIQRAVVEMLYDAGIIGVHAGKSHPQYSYEYQLRRIDNNDLLTVRLPFHRTFYGYFDVPCDRP